MRQPIVAVRDVALEAFGRPFVCQTLGVACRSFEDEVRRADSEMSRHPKDFALYHLGFFDDESGRFESLDNPARLVDASSVVFLKGDGHASVEAEVGS